MPQLRRCAGLAQKTNPRRFVTEIFFADDFQCHRAVQIDVKRLVGDPHRTATKLDRFPVFARHQLIVLKSLHRLFRSCRLDRIFGSRRLARLNPASKALAKHADRTEFHRSRKLVAATQIGVGTTDEVAPPSEPSRPISGTRLSSRWLTFKRSADASIAHSGLING